MRSHAAAGWAGCLTRRRGERGEGKAPPYPPVLAGREEVPALPWRARLCQSQVHPAHVPYGHGVHRALYADELQHVGYEVRPVVLRHVPGCRVQPWEASRLEQLPEVVRQLHEDVEVAAAPPVVAEHVLEAESVVGLLHLEVVLDVPPEPPARHGVGGRFRVPDVEVGGEAPPVGGLVVYPLPAHARAGHAVPLRPFGAAHDVERDPVLPLSEGDFPCPRQVAYGLPPALLRADGHVARVARLEAHQGLGLRVRRRGAPLLEREDVLPAVALADAHHRPAGVERVAHDAYRQAREAPLYPPGEDLEPGELAVDLAVLVEVLLDGARPERQGDPAGAEQLRLELVPDPRALRAADAPHALLLGGVEREEEVAAVAGRVQELAAHHGAGHAVQGVEEARRRHPTEQVAARLAGGRVKRLSGRPLREVLPGDAQHALRVLAGVPVAVHAIARPPPKEHPQQDGPGYRARFVRAALFLPEVGNAVECRVEDPAPPGDEGAELPERGLVVRRWRRLAPPPGAGRPISRRNSALWSSLSSRSAAFSSLQFSTHSDTRFWCSFGTKSVLVLPSALSVTVILSEFPIRVLVTVPSRNRPLRHSVLILDMSALRSADPSGAFFDMMSNYTHYFGRSQAQKRALRKKISPPGTRRRERYGQTVGFPGGPGFPVSAKKTHL